MELDDVDRKILKILQADGRTALSEIARRLEMGNATIHERVDSLEAAGYIKEYRAVLDPELLGIDQVAFINVRTEPGVFSSVAERLAEEPDIQEIHEVTGEFDLLLKARLVDRAELTDLLTEIGGSDGVVETATDVVLRSVKDQQQLNLADR
ncbi:MAG: Lrp/AsnC family transcriptional regulator [Halanaeroarchaeum sp.]